MNKIVILPKLKLFLKSLKKNKININETKELKIIKISFNGIKKFNNCAKKPINTIPYNAISKIFTFSIYLLILKKLQKTKPNPKILITNITWLKNKLYTILFYFFYNIKLC